MTLSPTYEAKHENYGPHYSGNTLSIVFSFFGFGINFGKNCWDEANEKTNNHDNTTGQLQQGRLLSNNQQPSGKKKSTAVLMSNRACGGGGGVEGEGGEGEGVEGGQR